jgi:surface antigen
MGVPMGTIKQIFYRLISYFKDQIRRSNEKLLLAAVILFGLIFSLVNPVKGMEQFLFLGFQQGESIIVEEALKESQFISESLSVNQSYLTANSLASLTGQSNVSSATEQYSSQENSLIVLQEEALLAQNCPTTIVSQDPRSGLITYIVQEGDTSSSIAASFGITTNTLLWANKLTATSLIRPGDELTVLPVSGVLHRVKSGDTISSIAKYYQADEEEVIVFNALPADGTIQEGQKLVVPDGQMPSTQPSYSYVAQQNYSGAGTGQSRSFPYGQCTWYVAQKRVVTWSGHAKNWLANAQAQGYSVCIGSSCQPTVGAIVSLKDGGWLARLYGHVAYVIKVEQDRFLISEMNRIGWGQVSVRWINIGSSNVRGFIY